MTIDRFPCSHTTCQTIWPFPILTTASLKHSEHLRSIRATEVFDRNLPSTEPISGIKKPTGNRPIKHVFDTVSSAKTEQDGLNILAPGGEIVLVLPLAVTAPEDKKVITVSGFFRDPNNDELLVTLYHHIAAWLEQGIIKASLMLFVP